MAKQPKFDPQKPQAAESARQEKGGVYQRGFETTTTKAIKGDKGGVDNTETKPAEKGSDD